MATLAKIDPQHRAALGSEIAASGASVGRLLRCNNAGAPNSSDSVLTRRHQNFEKNLPPRFVLTSSWRRDGITIARIGAGGRHDADSEREMYGKWAPRSYLAAERGSRKKAPGCRSDASAALQASRNSCCANQRLGHSSNRPARPRSKRIPLFDNFARAHHAAPRNS